MAFAKDLAERNLPPPEVYEVTSAAVWDEQCQVRCMCLDSYRAEEKMLTVRHTRRERTGYAW